VIERKNPLSNEFKVACEIYCYEIHGKKVWFSEMVLKLNGKLSQNAIEHALKVLVDWGIVKAEVGSGRKDRVCKYLYIESSCKPLIKQLYEMYWKNHRGKEDVYEL
jgi:DNA-binding HxlR family transcriptional regulator